MGIELEIDGSPWSVLRPLGNPHVVSSAAEDLSLEEVIASGAQGAGFPAYLHALEGLVPPLAQRSDFPFKWGHLLAWLSRDQECRLRKFEVWRDSDSKSESPGFPRPKELPIHLMLGVLGLLAPEQAVAQTELTRLEAKHKELKRQKQDLDLEPKFRYNDAFRALKRIIGEVPDTRNDPQRSLHDPRTIGETQLAAMHTEAGQLEESLNAIEKRIFIYQRTLANAEQQKNTLETLIAGKAPLAQKSGWAPHSEKTEELKTLQNKIADEEQSCTYAGHLPLKDCSYLLQHIENLKILRMDEFKREQAMKGMASARKDEIETLKKSLQEHDANLREAKRLFEAAQQERTAQLEAIRKKSSTIGKLEAALQEYTIAEKQAMGLLANTPLNSVVEELDRVDADIFHAKAQLEFHRAQSGEKLEQFTVRYSELVQRVLKADYKGTVLLTAADFQPFICDDSAISGAAVESLSFILGDVASMLAPVHNIGEHPGFLMHDSPREADLSLGPYHSLLSELAAISEEMGGAYEAPFQYIITTTTEPPPTLEKWVRFELAAAPETEMLFGQRLRAEMALSPTDQ